MTDTHTDSAAPAQPSAPRPSVASRLAFLRSPGWLGAIAGALAFAAICFWVLAPWQFNRHVERDLRNSEIAVAIGAQPVPLAQRLSTTDGIDPGETWQQVTASGHFLADRQVAVRLRQDDNNGSTPASEILVPLQLDDGSVLLVDRGYLSIDALTGAGIERVVLTVDAEHRPVVEELLTRTRPTASVEVTEPSTWWADATRHAHVVLVDPLCPLVPASFVATVLARASDGSAHAGYRPVTDTVKTMVEDHVEGTLDRSALAIVTSPVVFAGRVLAGAPAPPASGPASRGPRRAPRPAGPPAWRRARGARRRSPARRASRAR